VAARKRGEAGVGDDHEAVELGSVEAVEGLQRALVTHAEDVLQLAVDDPRPLAVLDAVAPERDQRVERPGHAELLLGLAQAVGHALAGDEVPGGGGVEAAGPGGLRGRSALEEHALAAHDPEVEGDVPVAVAVDRGALLDAGVGAGLVEDVEQLVLAHGGHGRAWPAGSVGTLALMAPEGYDEAFVRSGVPRAQYAAVLEALGAGELDALRARLAAEVAALEVTFGLGPDAPDFHLDPVPRVLTAGEWSELEAGLVQRARALNAFVADAYGERRIVAAGVVPARVIDSAQHFEPLMAGARFAGAGPVAIAGLDVVRDPSGAFLVLEDNVRTPSGLAYAVGARAALAAVLGPAGGAVAVEPVFELLAAALRAAAPAGREEPCVAVVSDGPENTAWFEHREVARRLGLALVRPDELEVDGAVVRVVVDGRRDRVDVVYRRTDEDRLTGDDGAPTPLGALLHAPCRAGTLGCVNAFGAGVADDKLAHAYVEDMVRFYLAEEPRLRSVPTYDLGDPAVRERLLDRMDELVVKPRAESGGQGIFVGPHARERDREAMAEEVRRAPEAFVAQETISLSHHPTVVDGGRLEPRHVDLRAIVLLAGERAGALPGGLTRVALEAGSLVVNSSQGGGAKDTWVLRGEGQHGRDPDPRGADTPLA
jgi:uncharacterized circularly permuted ATP-grasp superfamily protein